MNDTSYMADDEHHNPGGCSARGVKQHVNWARPGMPPRT
jgi:hypothetical protein